ncbi:MAG: RsmB/NOP family class I SAM-dependent RNA methyltransferase [Pseudomonadota bacterium]
MTPAARINAAIELMDRVCAGELASRALADWGRVNRYAGSKDRAAISDLVYEVLRKKKSFEAYGGGKTGRALLLGYLRSNGQEPDSIFGSDKYAPPQLTDEEHQRAQNALNRLDEFHDFPEWLWPDLVRSHGGNALAIAKALRDRAPVHLRVNLRKITRDDAIGALAKEGITTEALSVSPTALNVVEGARRVRNSESYLNGLVELQDASSQAVADSAPLSHGQTFLDFCAGAGGKVLAVAGRASGDFYAYEANPRRMKDLPSRAHRAGVNIELVQTKDQLGFQQFDTVMLDAPCSGSGSWRRDPQGKWLLTAEKLDHILSIQRDILKEAVSFVRPKGHLVYATCSLINRENAFQTRAFVSENEGFEIVNESHFTPLSGSDGFYCCVLKRN